MKSTDQNLNNPMVVDTVGLYPDLSTNGIPEVVTLTTKDYDLLQTKDPTSIYIISDSNRKDVYLGSSLIEKDIITRMYLLGPANKLGEYILYLNEATLYSDRLIKICRYTDAQVAITELNKFNNAGSHQTLNLQVYNVLSEYIVKDISLHDMLVGIIALFGYRDDIRLQRVLQMLIPYDPGRIFKDLPLLLQRDLKVFINNGNHLFRLYSSLYDLVVSYKYFKAKEFHLDDPDKVDLSKVIDKVLLIMTNAL